MSYSETGIINLALGRIGVKVVTSRTDGTPQAIRANAVFDYIRDEVLEAGDWKFAKTRVVLAKSATDPTYNWSYAYPLPANCLRLAKDGHEDPAVAPDGVIENPYPYIVETLSDGNLAILINYDNTDYDLYCTYIKRITDTNKFTASFINALAWRLGAELSIALTEGLTKFDFCMKMYQAFLSQAEGMNQTQDSLEDEQGDDSWETAGRS